MSDDKISKEASIIARTQAPVTRARLLQGFESLGVTPGQCLMVHSSMSAIGWIPGGVQLLVEALLEAVGPDGTLMVPTFSTHRTDPANWEAPPVPKAWHDEVRQEFPVWDTNMSETRGMGQLPEAVRHLPGAHRSLHPHTSFSAIGPLARNLTKDHELSSPLGKSSPLQKLYDVDGTTLLLGTGFDANTCFHLGEEVLDNPPVLKDGTTLLRGGSPEWVTFEAIDYDSEDFEEMGKAFLETGKTRHGKVGAANCHIFRTRDAVDFSRVWLRQNR